MWVNQKVRKVLCVAGRSAARAGACVCGAGLGPPAAGRNRPALKLKAAPGCRVGLSQSTSTEAESARRDELPYCWSNVSRNLCSFLSLLVRSGLAWLGWVSIRGRALACGPAGPVLAPQRFTFFSSYCAVAKLPWDTQATAVSGTRLSPPAASCRLSENVTWSGIGCAAVEGIKTK